MSKMYMCCVDMSGFCPIKPQINKPVLYHRSDTDNNKAKKAPHLSEGLEIWLYRSTIPFFSQSDFISSGQIDTCTSPTCALPKRSIHILD